MKSMKRSQDMVGVVDKPIPLPSRAGTIIIKI